MTPRARRRPRGFTLVEILVAILIFAILTGMAYRVLFTVLESRERVERDANRWREIGLAVARIEQDVGALLNRPARDAGGIQQRPIVGVQVPRGDEGQIMLTRMGALDLPGALGAPQRVGYRLRDGRIEQLVWPVLDQAPRTRPTATPILDEVAAFELRYLGANGWQALWPPPNPTSGGPGQEAPAAIELQIQLANGVRIRRLFATAWGFRG